VLRKLKFEAYDRHLGMLLGGAEGALLGSVVTLFVLSQAPSTRGPILASPSGRLLGAVMNRVEPLLPGEIRDELHPFWGEAPVVAAARDDEWEDLKRPLESPREVAEPRRVAVGEPERPAAESRATAGRVAAGAIQEGVEYLAGPDGEDKDSSARRIGRAVAGTLADEIDRMGEPKQPGNSRGRRIGRAVANLIGEEIDRRGTRDDGRQDRDPQRR
jgi:membrane protein required for colicin V production